MHVTIGSETAHTLEQALFENHVGSCRNEVLVGQQVDPTTLLHHACDAKLFGERILRIEYRALGANRIPAFIDDDEIAKSKIEFLLTEPCGEDFEAARTQ